MKNENCTQCHGEVRAHGNNRNHVRGCVLCHTAGSEDGTGGGASDAIPGATIDFGVMIHKIHAGAHLPSVLGVTTNPNGTRKYDATPQPYQLIGFQNSVHDYSEVSFPQWPSFCTGMPRDAGHTALSSTAQGLENTMRAAPVGCAKCHGDPDGSGPLTAPTQGDVIFTNPTRRLCRSCHDDWDPAKPYTANTSTMPEQTDDATCKDCHGVSGDPLAVVDAHRHPLVDPALATGVNFDVTAVTDVGGNANGKFEPGEKVGITFSAKDDAGNAIAASSLSRIEVVISGPTANPQALNHQRFGQAFFSGTGPYTVNMPAIYFHEPVGSSTAALETFTTANRPHWNVANALTSLLRRTGTGAGSTLAAAAAVTQNCIDVAPGTGTSFAKDNYIVIDDASVCLREYMRIQWVNGDASGSARGPARTASRTWRVGTSICVPDHPEPKPTRSAPRATASTPSPHLTDIPQPLGAAVCCSTVRPLPRRHPARCVAERLAGRVEVAGEPREDVAHDAHARSGQVFRTMNSSRMSFWLVPDSLCAGTPCSAAAATQRARIDSTAPFMVIDTDTLSSGMPSNRMRMSTIESTATPAMPRSGLQPGLPMRVETRGSVAASGGPG